MAALEGIAHIVRYANPAFCRLCNQEITDLLGCPLTEILPEEGENGCLSLLERVYRTGEAEYALDREHIDPVRGPVYWSYAAWAVLGEAVHPTWLMLQVMDSADIALGRQGHASTEAQIREINQALVIAAVYQQELAEAMAEAGNARAEDQLRKAAQERLMAVAEERSRLACEIHDTLAQAFAGMLLQLRVAQRIAKQKPEEAWSLIEYVSELAQQGLVEARRSMWALQPEAHEYSDLASTLSMTVERMRSSTPVQIQLQIHGVPRTLPPDVGMNLLRIAQEALTNALRHAQAQNIRIELTLDAEPLLLCIRDDGRGSDLRHQTEGGGFGLIGMRQRAARLGGHLLFSSQPGKGTEVTVWVPLHAVQCGEEKE